MSYRRFGSITALSTAVMYGLMYLNTFELGHVFPSQTRLWMALIMGASMAILMMAFMWDMYENRKYNAAILAASTLIFSLSLWLVRSQATVSDISYMEAMIPHHSIAVLTSQRAHIRDPRVRKLADGILRTQLEEIEEMKSLISDLRNNPTARNARDLPPSNS